MHAFLVIGKTKEERDKEISSRIAAQKISKWDTIILSDNPTIGIENIRDFERHLRLTPQNSKAKAGVLSAIERLTIPAQNALLKTLEEPPPNTYIYAETSVPDALLPTILSRFTMVNLGEKKEKTSIDPVIIQKLMTVSIGKRMQIIDSLLETSDAKSVCNNLILAARRELLDHPSSELTKLIRNLFTAQQQLSVNVNPKLVLDNIFLNLA